MSYTALNPAKVAVMFFDMTNYYYRGASAEIQRRMEPVVANCVSLAATAREMSIAIFFVKPDHRPDGLDSAALYTDTDMRLAPWQNPEAEHFHAHHVVAGGTWNAEIIDEIKPAPGDTIIVKHRWSAFLQTPLELSLRTRGIDTIVLCGAQTDVGVASTAYDARDLDFNLVIVRDACSAAILDNHEQFVNRIYPRMARVRTTEEVTQMLQRAEP